MKFKNLDNAECHECGKTSDKCNGWFSASDKFEELCLDCMLKSTTNPLNSCQP